MRGLWLKARPAWRSLTGPGPGRLTSPFSYTKLPPNFQAWTLVLQAQDTRDSQTLLLHEGKL